MHIQISQRRRRQFHSENKGKKRRFFPEADLEGCAGGARLLFLQSFVFLQSRSRIKN